MFESGSSIRSMLSFLSKNQQSHTSGTEKLVESQHLSQTESVRKNYVRLCQCGPTTFDLRAILQKRDNSPANSHKMVHKKQIDRILYRKRKIGE